MPIVALASLDDPRAAAYRAVRDPELVLRQGLFVAEGRLVVERLLSLRRYTVQSLLLSPTALSAMRQTLVGLPPEVPILIAEPDQFATLTGVHIHRGCLALVQRPAPRPIDATVAGARLVLALEGVSNPDNVGGIFRNAAAFGVEAVVVGPGCCDPFYRKAIRTSMGAVLGVPFAQAGDWPDTLDRLKRGGFVIIALTPGPRSIPLESFVEMPRPDRLVLLLGAEGEGLSAQALEASSVRLRIPIHAAVDSLNVAVAAGIALARLVTVQ